MNAPLSVGLSSVTPEVKRARSNPAATRSDRVTARIGVFKVFDETYSWWSDVAGVSNTSLVKNAYTQPGRNVAVSLALRF